MMTSVREYSRFTLYFLTFGSRKIPKLRRLREHVSGVCDVCGVCGVSFLTDRHKCRQEQPILQQGPFFDLQLLPQKHASMNE